MDKLSAASAAFRSIVKFKRRAKPFDFYCVVVGDPHVGKTAFVEWLVFKAETSLYVPTILEAYAARGTADIMTSLCQITWKKFTLQITDTSGLNEYAPLRAVAYKEVNIVCLFFDVTDRNSFHHARDKWFDEIAHSFGARPEAVLVLIGTHADLRVSRGGVLASEGRELAYELGAVGYFECNCTSGASISKTFSDMMSKVVDVKDYLEAVQIQRNDSTIMASFRSPTDGISTCHISTVDGRLVFHSAPFHWQLLFVKAPEGSFRQATSFPKAKKPLHSVVPKFLSQLGGLLRRRKSTLNLPQIMSLRIAARKAREAATLAPPTGPTTLTVTPPSSDIQITIDTDIHPSGADAESDYEEYIREDTGESDNDNPSSVAFDRDSSSPGIELPQRRPRPVSCPSSPTALYAQMSGRSPSPFGLSRSPIPTRSDASAQRSPSTTIDAPIPTVVFDKDEEEIMAALKFSGRVSPLTLPYGELKAELNKLREQVVNAEQQGLPAVKYLPQLERILQIIQSIPTLHDIETWRALRKLVTVYCAIATEGLRAGMRMSEVYKHLLNAKRLLEGFGEFPMQYRSQYHDMLAFVYQKLAWLYRKMDKLDTAVACMMTAVDYERKANKDLQVYGHPKRSIAASTHLHLSALLVQVGRYDDALNQATRAVRKLEIEKSDRFTSISSSDNDSRYSGDRPESPMTSSAGDDFHVQPKAALAIAYYNVGVSCEHLERLPECIQAYQSAVQESLTELGSSHSTTKMLIQALQSVQKQPLPESLSAVPVLSVSTTSHESLSQSPLNSSVLRPVSVSRIRPPSPAPSSVTNRQALTSYLMTHDSRTTSIRPRSAGSSPLNVSDTPTPTDAPFIATAVTSQPKPRIQRQAPPPK